MTTPAQLYKFNDDLLFEVVNPLMPNLLGTVDERKVRFVCAKHRIRMVVEETGELMRSCKLSCLLCEREHEGENYLASIAPRFPGTLHALEQKALALLDRDQYKDAKIIRLDEYYVPELKRKIPLADSDYFAHVDIKTDQDGHSIIVLYIGHKGDREKAQFFIKPEKLGLSHDYKDLDPAKILAKIEVTLKDRTLTQDFTEEKK